MHSMKPYSPPHGRTSVFGMAPEARWILLAAFSVEAQRTRDFSGAPF